MIYEIVERRRRKGRKKGWVGKRKRSGRGEREWKKEREKEDGKNRITGIRIDNKKKKWRRQR